MTKVRRAVGRFSPRRDLSERARLILDGVALLAVEQEILEKAAGLAPAELRTLDAILFASALSLGATLRVINVPIHDRIPGRERPVASALGMTAQ